MSTKRLVSRFTSFLFIAALLFAQAAPVYAADTGTITGAINDTDGNPVTGTTIQVRAVLKTDGSEVATTTSNPADGSYTLASLPLDTDLAVIASDEDPETDGFAPQYYSHVGTLNWAQTIVLTNGSPNRADVDLFLYADSYSTIEHLSFNVRSGRLLEDVQLRQAIAYGTDRQTLFDDAFLPEGMTGEVVHTMVSPNAWFLADPADLTVYNYNKTQAETILANAGWVDTDADGIRENASNQELALDFITVMVPARMAAADLFKAQMFEIGILVNVTTYPSHIFWDGDPAVSPLRAGNFDIAEFAWGLSDNHDELLDAYNDGNLYNYGGFVSATLEGYFNAAQAAKVTGSQPGFESNALDWQQTFTDELPALPLFTRAGPMRPLPNIGVRAHSDTVEGWNWVDGSTVTIEIDRDHDGTPEISRTAVVGPAPWNPDEIRFDYNFSGEFDIQAGDIVTVSDGMITKETLVSIHSITEVDTNTDTVSGVSDPGFNVDVWVCDEVNCYNRHVAAHAVTGVWQADFAHVGTGDDEQQIFDIVPGTWVDSSQNDYDGDSTMYGINAPNPRFQVRANEDRVEGNEWQLGSTVTINVSRAGTSVSQDVLVEAAPWDPNQTYFESRVTGQFDILPGDSVSVTDGNITKTTIVTPLAFTDVDWAADVVTGIASPSANVNIWACEPNNGPCHNRHITAHATTGVWQADFAHVGTEDDEQTVTDIRLGTWIDSEQFDADADSTMYGVNVPNPFIEASRQENWVNAREWRVGTLVTMEIDDLSNGLGGVDYTRTATMQQAPWNPGDPNDIVGAFDMSGFTLEIGDVVTVYGDLDGNLISKELIISPLQVTAIDVEADAISGLATPGGQVEVCVNRPSDCLSRVVTANGAGAWTANYAPEYDIQPGQNGWAGEFDPDSDRNWYNWEIRQPHMDTWFADDIISVYDWPLGEQVTLEIDDPATPATIDYTAVATIIVAPWDPNATWAEFNLAGVFDIDTGMMIKVIHSFATKQMNVLPLAVTEANTLTDVVTGTSAPNQALWMWQEASCCRNFQSDTGGAWSLDFSVVGSNGEPILDVVPGTFGTVNAVDADGDNTSLNWFARGSIPATWVGGISIQSDQPIVAVGRPHLGAEVASYINSTAGGATQFVPMLFKGAFGGGYNAALYIQNISGESASLTMEFTDSSGTVVYTKTDTLDPNASKGYWLPSEVDLPNGFVGGVKVISNRDIIALGRPHINGQVMTYNGVGAGSTIAWLPMFFKNGFGSYNTALYIQNVTASNANLTIQYINLDGTVACTDTDTLGANASKGYWSLAVACDSGSLPLGFVGGVKVTSTQNILAVGRAHLGTQITTYNGFAGGAGSAYVPMLFRKAYAGGSYNAALYLQNVSGSSADVTIEYVDNAGAIAATQNVTLAAGAISSLWLPSVAGLPDGFVGGARISATQDVIAVGRPHLGGEITAYNGTSAGSLNAYLPMLFKNAYAAPYQAAFYIQNVTGSAANVDIRFYDSAGVLSCIKTINLAANATTGFWMPTVTCGP